jgi:hypothetical protein
MLRETAWLVVLVAVLIAAMLVAFFVLPPAVVSHGDLREEIPTTATGLQTATEPTGVDLVNARNGVRTAAVALVAGIGAALATGFAARTYYLARRGQLTDRYKAAVEQLAGDATVQVSAIGDLERLAGEVPSRHRQIMEVLATFLRTHARDDDEDAEVPAAVQAAFAVLARRRRRFDRGLVLDLAGADLRQVNFERARLRGAVLRDARLDGAFLQRSDLREANLTDAVAPSVRLDDAKLHGAIFAGANLRGATLDDADVRKAKFDAAQLADTFLRGTDLRRATGLSIEEGRIVGCKTDERTKLPDRTRPSRGPTRG